VFTAFREIWAVDFEFEFGGGRDNGERPRPVCLVAKELRTGRTVRQWRDEFGPLPPYPLDRGSLFIAFMASAELGCHLALGWPMPERILDPFVENAASVNGLSLRRSLINALTNRGLDHIGAIEKTEMINLILTGGPWSEADKTAILDYCQSDVEALARLLPAMTIDLPRALLRGRYMAAAARIEHRGIPIDTGLLQRLLAHWEAIKLGLITAVDADFGVYEGQTFKADRFAAWLTRTGTPWPRLDSGALDLEDDTFRSMAKVCPAVSPLRELRHALSQLRLNELAVGSDRRNRTLLSVFRSITGRNQPSNSRSIFGPSVWMRGLIKPEPGTALAYIDWNAQEFGIGAALSKDPVMMEAYLSGDPHLAFAKRVGAVPQSATKSSHRATRELYKTCVHGIGYGMGEQALGYRIGQPPIVARELIRQYHETYRVFSAWADEQVANAMLTNQMRTVFGWPLHVTGLTKERTLRNFQMQGNGSEILRLACCLATECGIGLCMPVHDAVLIEADLAEIGDAVAAMQDAMAEASRVVLDGFELGTEAKIVRYPERYADLRGVIMWERVQSLLVKAESRRRVTEFDLDTVRYFIREREAVRVRKERGDPRPWTDDPIMQVASFCNVHREDDRVSRWIAKNWRTPHADDPDLWFAMVVARLVNWPDTLAEIDYPVPWDPDHFLAVMVARRARSEKTTYGPAYTISAGTKGQLKPVYQMSQIFGPLWAAREQLRPKPGQSLIAWYSLLRDFHGMGSFMAAQVVADIKYVEPLTKAPDWWTFAASGPGSRRGLNRISGRPVDAGWREADWYRQLRRLHDVLAIDPPLHCQDLQNVLCEVDKLLRYRGGQGKPKRQYVPHDDAGVPTPARMSGTIPPTPARMV